VRGGRGLRVPPVPVARQVTVDTLEKLNVPQGAKENKQFLDELGGIPGFIQKLKVDTNTGLTDEQVEQMRAR
jgi:hypothetical protein